MTFDMKHLYVVQIDGVCYPAERIEPTDGKPYYFIYKADKQIPLEWADKANVYTGDILPLLTGCRESLSMAAFMAAPEKYADCVKIFIKDRKPFIRSDWYPGTENHPEQIPEVIYSLLENRKIVKHCMGFSLRYESEYEAYFALSNACIEYAKQQKELKKRKPGFYWTKFNKNSPWTPEYWNGLVWGADDEHKGLNSDDFWDIGTAIELPEGLK